MSEGRSEKSALSVSDDSDGEHDLIVTSRHYTRDPMGSTSDSTGSSSPLSSSDNGRSPAQDEPPRSATGRKEKACAAPVRSAGRGGRSIYVGTVVGASETRRGCGATAGTGSGNEGRDDRRGGVEGGDRASLREGGRSIRGEDDGGRASWGGEERGSTPRGASTGWEEGGRGATHPPPSLSQPRPYPQPQQHPMFEVEELSKRQLEIALDARQHLLGEGSSGAVYRGSFRGTPVAIKLFFKDTTRGSGILSEVSVLLQHHGCAGIVALRGYCKRPQALVYEYLEGGDLHKRLKYLADGEASGGGNGSASGSGRRGGGLNGDLPWAVRLRMAHEIAASLRGLHESQPPILHRDLKPANILLDGENHCKLADFGLARTCEDAVSCAGTLGFVDPAVHRTGRMTLESDVFSLGRTLLHLFTGLTRAKHLHALLGPYCIPEGRWEKALVFPGLPDKASPGNGLGQKAGLFGGRTAAKGTGKVLCSGTKGESSGEQLGVPGGGRQLGTPELVGIAMAHLDSKAGAWPREVMKPVLKTVLHCASPNPKCRPTLAFVCRVLEAASRWAEESSAIPTSPPTSNPTCLPTSNPTCLPTSLPPTATPTSAHALHDSAAQPQVDAPLRTKVPLAVSSALGLPEDAHYPLPSLASPLPTPAPSSPSLSSPTSFSALGLARRFAASPLRDRGSRAPGVPGASGVPDTAGAPGRTSARSTRQGSRSPRSSSPLHARLAEVGVGLGLGLGAWSPRSASPLGHRSPSGTASPLRHRSPSRTESPSGTDRASPLQSTARSPSGTARSSPLKSRSPSGTARGPPLRVGPGSPRSVSPLSNGSAASVSTRRGPTADVGTAPPLPLKGRNAATPPRALSPLAPAQPQQATPAPDKQGRVPGTPQEGIVPSQSGAPRERSVPMKWKQISVTRAHRRRGSSPLNGEDASSIASTSSSPISNVTGDSGVSVTRVGNHRGCMEPYNRAWSSQTELSAAEVDIEVDGCNVGGRALRQEGGGPIAPRGSDSLAQQAISDEISDRSYSLEGVNSLYGVPGDTLCPSGDSLSRPEGRLCRQGSLDCSDRLYHPADSLAEGVKVGQGLPGGEQTTPGLGRRELWAAGASLSSSGRGPGAGGTAQCNESQYSAYSPGRGVPRGALVGGGSRRGSSWNREAPNPYVLQGEVQDTDEAPAGGSPTFHARVSVAPADHADGASCKAPAGRSRALVKAGSDKSLLERPHAHWMSLGDGTRYSASRLGSGGKDSTGSSGSQGGGSGRALAAKSAREREGTGRERGGGKRGAQMVPRVLSGASWDVFSLSRNFLSNTVSEDPILL